MNRFVATLCFLACTGAIADDAAQVDTDARWLTREWPEKLYESDDPEQLLIGALLAQSPNSESPHPPEDFFRKALARDADNSLLLFDAAAYCLRQDGPAVCDESLLHRLSEFDSESGAAWALRAFQSERAGHSRAALDHLRRAATSKDFDGYFMRHMTVFDQVLRAWRPQSAAERFLMAIGLTVGVATEGFGILPVCRERADTDAEWRHQCLRLGEAMERHARTELTARLGLVLQIATLELDDADETLTEARARIEARRSRSGGDDGLDAVLNDDGFWNDYLSVFVREGEASARDWATRRITDLPEKDP